MFAVGYIPSSGIEQFDDFWKCPGIFNKAQNTITELENRNKRKRTETYPHLPGLLL